MNNINIHFSDKEIDQLTEKKLAESKRQQKELSWKELFLIAVEKVSK